MIEFISFTNQRNKEYQLTTEIISENGKKSVVKLPLSVEAASHISRIKKTLSSGLDTAHFEYIHSGEYNQGISFDFAEGDSVQIYLDRLLDADQTAEFKSYLTEFLQIYRGDFSGSLSSFKVTEPFKEWFGTPDLPAVLAVKDAPEAQAASAAGDMSDAQPASDAGAAAFVPAAPFANIDITFDNLIMKDMTHFTVIDPEWVFDFPVPFEYPIYRTLKRYFINSIDGKFEYLLSFEDLIDLAGINRALIPAYDEMDVHFNRRVFDSKTPRLQPAHSVLEMLDQNSFASQVYLTDPPQEDASVLYNIDSSEQKIIFAVDSSSVNTVRFDPVMTSGIVHIASCIGLKASNDPVNLTYHSDAEVAAGDILMFCHDDPKVFIELQDQQFDMIEVRFRVLLTGLPLTSLLSSRIDTALTQLKETTTALALQEQKYSSLEDYLNSYLARMTELEKDNARLHGENEILQVKYTNRTIKGFFRRIARVLLRIIRGIAKKLGLTRHSLLVQAVRHPSKVLKAFKVIRNQGFSGLSKKIKGTRTRTFIDPNEKVDSKLLKQMKTVISIVMPVYNVDVKWLDLAVKSVMNQKYPNWQLCIADDCSTNQETKAYLKSLSDPRISVVFLEKNSGIAAASNEAAKLVKGEFIALMDNDDEYHPNALYELAKAIDASSPDILYTDEDKIDAAGQHRFPFYKPDWSPDLLNSQMYIGHIFCFRKTLFEAVKGFDPEYNGSQDYDLAFRLTEKSSKIVHIPKVLYSWREIPSSTAADPSAKPYSHTAGLKALDSHLKRKYGQGAHAQETEYFFVYKPGFDVDPEKTKVSVIIPMKDKVELTRKCIYSIFSKTTYSNFEIILVNNRSEEPETYEWFKNIKEKYAAIKVIDADCEFNWSKINNIGARKSKGDVLVFLNNDTEIISPDWLDELAGNALRPDVGTVGALLLYEDGTIQHDGIVIGIGGWADHIYKGQKPVHFGSPFVSPMVIRNVSANTGACLAISRDKFLNWGGFDEKFIICGSDVELSIRATSLGYFNVFLPTISLYHLESKSRDSYIPENDFELCYSSYTPYRLNGDPFYNPNLSYDNADVKQIERPRDKHRVK